MILKDITRFIALFILTLSVTVIYGLGSTLGYELVHEHETPHSSEHGHHHHHHHHENDRGHGHDGETEEESDQETESSSHEHCHYVSFPTQFIANSPDFFSCGRLIPSRETSVSELFLAPDEPTYALSKPPQ